MDESTPTHPLISLPNQKNVVKFFRSFDLAQVVCIKVNQSKFLVNSILLVLHSPVFENLIYSGAEEIILDDSLQFPGAEVMLHQCLLYLYGDTVNLDLGQIPNFYHFAFVYKISSLQEQCEKSFVKLLPSVDTYVAYLSKWSSNGRGHWYKGLIIKNCHEIIQLLTASENLPTVLKIIRSESGSHDSIIPAMLPCQEMLSMFYTEMTKKVTEPSDAIQLNLIKNKYCGSSTIPSRRIDNYTIDSESIHNVKLNRMKNKYCDSSNDSPICIDHSTNSESIVTKESKSVKTDVILEQATSSSSAATTTFSLKPIIIENSVCNKKPVAAEEPNGNLYIGAKSSSSSSDRLSSVSSSTSKSDLTSYVTQVKDFSQLATGDRKDLLSLSFADVIELAKTIQRDDVQNYLKIDIVLTWMFLKKYKISDKGYSTFCSSFNNRILAREYLLDVLEVLSNVEKSNRVIDCKNNHDRTFFISSKVMSQNCVQTRIKQNGSIVLQDADCQFGSCKVENHKLHLFVLLKKTLSDSATVLPKSTSCEIHLTNLIHVYLLGLNKDLFVENIISLKVLTKAEIIKACSQYPNFVLKVIYRQQPLKSKSQSSLNNDNSSIGSSKREDSQENLSIASSSGATEQSIGFIEVFKGRSWKNFLFAELSKFMRTGYSKQQKITYQMYNILKTKSDFIYLCIDIFFSLVLLGKLSLQDQLYRCFICAFDHSLISSEFVKDMKTVFNSALQTPVPVMSKSGCKDSFLVTVSLDKKSLQHTISHNGIISSGVVGDQCQMTKCQIENHTLDMQIYLNKSESDLTVNVIPRMKNSNIHKGKMLHFYLLALNSKDEASRLISLKLLSKSEVLQSVKRYPKFKLRVIYSKN